MGSPDWDNYVKQILTTGQLFFAETPRLNDPFDPLPQCLASAPPDELRKLLHLAIADAYPGLSASEKERREEEMMQPGVLAGIDDIVRDLLNRGGVACFSEVNDEILMWSHYTNGHRGICLEFEKDLLDAEWSRFHGVRRVLYSDDLPAFDPTLPGIERTIRRILTKYSGWKYEKEWRAMNVPEKGPGSANINFPPDSLTALIFGCRTADSHKRLIQDWIAAGPCKNVKLCEARPKRESFALDIVDYRP